MVKKILIAAALFLLLAGVSSAQDGPPPRDKGDKKMNPEEMAKRELKMLTKELDLTDTQVTFVQKILEESAKQMKEQMQSGTKDFDAMKKIQEDKDSKLKSVLTDEQWDKYKEIKDKRKDKFKNGDNPPPNDR